MTGKAPAKSDLRRFIRVKPKLDFEALQPGAELPKKSAAPLQPLGLHRQRR